MQRVKIKASAMIIAQIKEGSEVDAIVVDGQLYLPTVDLSAVLKATKGGKSEAVPEEAEEEEDDAPKKPAKKAKPAPAAKASKKVVAKEDEEDEEEAEEEGDDDLKEKVSAIFESYDDGTLNKKDAAKKLAKLADDADEKALSEQLQKFTDDEDMDIDDIVDETVAILNGEAPKEEEEEEDEDEDEDAPKPKKGSSAKASKKEKEPVAITDYSKLKVGQKVSVYWSNAKKWYDGEVESVKGSKVTIYYFEDEESEILSKEVHTKVNLIG